MPNTISTERPDYEETSFVQHQDLHLEEVFLAPLENMIEAASQHNVETNPRVRKWRKWKRPLLMVIDGLAKDTNNSKR